MRYLNKILCYIGFMNCDVIEDLLTLEYHGSDVDQVGINSYEVANYIIAFSNFAGVVSRQAYGERIQLETNIQGFRGDSFDIDFVLHIAGVTAGLFSATSPLSAKDFIELVREAVKTWIHLNGAPPKKVSPISGNKNMIGVENQNGQLIYVTDSVVNVITDPKAGKAAEQFIKKPLEAGLSTVRINSKATGEPVTILHDDAPSFVPVIFDQPLLENDIKMGLVIESPTFKEGNKWKFYDGQSSFHADIVDKAFLQKVDDGTERFGKGDVLIAIVRLTQTSSIGSLKMEHTIVQVLGHEVAMEQSKLF